MISSPSGSPTISVCCCQISFRHSKGFSRAGVSNKGGVGKISSFLSLSVNISKTVADAAMTNRKSHMGFPLTPRSMTLDDLELYKFEFSENFSGFHRFRTQQQLNEWKGQYCQRQRWSNQFLACFRNARVCQRQLGFLVSSGAPIFTYFDTVGWVFWPVKNRRTYNLYCVDVKLCPINPILT